VRIKVVTYASTQHKNKNASVLPTIGIYRRATSIAKEIKSMIIRGAATAIRDNNGPVAGIDST
jgi:hypothetical protein